MKKVLILAYDFPPYVSVGGLRPYSWYKYFENFDIYPVVITRQWTNNYGNQLDYVSPGESSETIIEESDKGIIIRTPYKPNLANKIMLAYGTNKYKYLRRFISLFYEIFQWIFFIGPKSKLYYGAKKYLKQNKVDYIIATGEPFILFRYASILSSKFNIPWIADYRDPWIQKNPDKKSVIITKLEKSREKKYLKNSIIFTTVSEFFAKHISVNVKNKPYYIIPNGFDDDILLRDNNSFQNKDNLSIGFAGTIYKWHPWESFLKVIEKFVKVEGSKVSVNFYGINNEDEIRKKINIEFPAIKDFVNIYPRMNNEALITELEKNNVLLLFNYYSFMGTKIYDYLAIKRLILLCYSDDKDANSLKEKYYNHGKIEGVSEFVQAELIQETNSGIIIKDSEHLYNVLIELNNELKENKIIQCDSDNTEQFSRKKQAGKLAEIIKEIS